MAEVNLTIAGRSYQVGCRAGEEENLVAAARMVDAKSREALSGLGTLSESRQLLFASLLLADQLLAVDKINSQSAARLAVPLGRWRRFDTARGALMREQLQHIVSGGGVSKDVLEMASRALV